MDAPQAVSNPLFVMFSDNQNMENLQQLYSDIKKYVLLQKDYAKLELVEKLTALASALAMAFVLIVLGMIALLCLLFAAAYAIAPLVGGLPASFLIITGAVLLLMGAAYLWRKKLFIGPIVRFLGKLFLDKPQPGNNGNEKS